MEDAILKLLEFEQEAMQKPEDPFCVALVSACAVFKAVALRGTKDYNDAATVAIMGVFLTLLGLSSDLEELGKNLNDFTNKIESMING